MISIPTNKNNPRGQFSSKIKIGQSGDKYEKEADTMADRVMRMPQHDNSIQRKCENCEEESLQMKPLGAIAPMIQRQISEEEETVQMKSDGGKEPSNSNLFDQLNQSKGKGTKLSDSTNGFMNKSFGTDFNRVKIHTDSSAVQMNRALGVRAFTHGKDVYFNKGEYSPESNKGKHLLTHELTHVMQQSNKNLIQKQPTNKEDWTKDEEGNLYYKTKKEAEYRKGTLKNEGGWESYRVTSFSKKDKTFWRVEMKGLKSSEKTNSEELEVVEGSPTDSLSTDTVTSVEQKDENYLGNIEIRGDIKGEKILRVAWTIDDGPSGEKTKHMQGVSSEKTGLKGIKAATWYIQHNKLRNNKDKYKALKKIQDEGGEIAIHSFHPTEDHTAWFPIKGEHPAYSLPYSDKTEADIMKDLKGFHSKLIGYGIKTKFVRLPGGLSSELNFYAKTLGIKDWKVRSKIISAILNNSDVKSFGSSAVRIQKDYKVLKQTLSDLDLLLWGGSSNAHTIQRLSWQAETSGVGAREDNTTKKVSPKGKNSSKVDISKMGEFEKTIKGMKGGEARSLVILAHDSYLSDAKAVAEDKKEMEDVAKIKGIKIEYHTMSSIFQHVTGKDAATLDVKY